LFKKFDTTPSLVHCFCQVRFLNSAGDIGISAADGACAADGGGCCCCGRRAPDVKAGQVPGGTDPRHGNSKRSTGHLFSVLWKDHLVGRCLEALILDRGTRSEARGNCFPYCGKITL